MSESSDFEEQHEKSPMISMGHGYYVPGGKKQSSSSLLVLGVALFVSLAANAVFLIQPLLRGSQDLRTLVLNHTSQYWSPIMDDVEIRYESVRFDGSFVHMNESIYQQPPRPEVDEAWSGLGIDFRTAVVPEDRGEEAGIDPSAVKNKLSLGGGYLTNVEVLHHIHCLNMIRQTLPWNVDYYRDSSSGVYENSEPIVQLHVNHCMEIIRQQLMCASDVGMFGQRWIQRPGHDLNAFPIFDTLHKCRNFNDILEWARTHQAPDGSESELRDSDVVLTEYP